MRYNKLLKNLKSKKASVVYLIVSFFIFSVGIPLIQEKLTKVNYDGYNLQFHIARSDIWGFAARFHTNMANLIYALNLPPNERVKKVFQSNREDALEASRYKLMLLYIALNDRIPDQALLNKWAKMDLEELYNQIDKEYFIQFDITKKMRQTTTVYMIVKYVLYGIAILLYSLGMVGIHYSTKNV